MEKPKFIPVLALLSSVLIAPLVSVAATASASGGGACSHAVRIEACSRFQPPRPYHASRTPKLRGGCSRRPLCAGRVEQYADTKRGGIIVRGIGFRFLGRRCPSYYYTYAVSVPWEQTMPGEG